MFLLLGCCFFVYLSSKAAFHSGFFRTIDDVTTVRIMYPVKELTRFSFFNFPVRLSAELSHGYGYPLYLFYFSLRQKVKPLAALSASILYCPFPYRGWDSYI